ncbi:MAG: Beta sliding clamp [Eubacteriales bacterium SKADARSKE-1]|nr:Beta sliding clamp [Eubacteriales bacterium SKADARSKE-1]
MKITCNSQKLVEAVSNVQRAVSSKSCLTVLEGIFIKAEENQIILCGYDLEIGITTKIDANVKASGAIVLSAKIFSDIIRRMPSDEISISVDEKLVTTIKSGASEFSIVGIPPEDYPERPLINSFSDFTINSMTLKSMIRQTIFAVATTDEKPINTGTLFDVSENEINLVSVDGYRLAKRSEKISYNEKIGFVVPGKTLSEILKLLPDEEKEVNISVGKKHITFQIDNYSIISRLLEGDFLDYNSAIPSTKTTELVLNTKDFIESVERVSLVITDRLKSPIRCIFSNGQTKISCITPLGKANDEFQAEIEGDSVEIGFNNKYLLDALKNVDSDKVKIQMNGPLSPLKILPIEGNSFVFLVLPVRLKSQ